MSKILLIIIALIVVFGTFIFLGNKNTNPTTSEQSDSMKFQQATPTAMETSGQTANVVLGDSGFVPKDITIKAGTKVIWVNKSGTAATINSDDHPTHHLYPFLNLGEFGDGSSVQLLFDKPGKYTYHDHYNANNTGAVVVK